VTLTIACLFWGGCDPSRQPEEESRQVEGAPAIQASESARQLFEKNCVGCHSLELPLAQRLDRSNWEWVVSDMVEQYGATWITEEQQRVIIDYLTENYGPDKPRPGGG
jgi:mono/diheme cytochrome c family protein